jgi:hypothetical protein
MSGLPQGRGHKGRRSNRARIRKEVMPVYNYSTLPIKNDGVASAVNLGVMVNVTTASGHSTEVY